MTYTVETLHVGDGVTTQFGLDFVYQDPTHIRVSVDGVDVGYTAVSPAVVQVFPAPAAGSTVRVYRETPIANLNHSFQLGAPFLPAYVDANNLQSLYGVQESRSLSDKALTAADSAVQAVGLANSTAATAVSIANAATSTANNANATAQAATIAANGASTTAANAVATANSAVAAANSAGATANAASSAASAAESTANAASATAASAAATANAASTAATAAVSAANSATITANTAASTASTAIGVANAAAADAATAVQTADSAAAVAGGVDAKAQTALDTAEQAELKAAEALQAVSEAGVTSWNGRGGIVTPQAGDYTAAQVSRGASNVDAAISALEAGKADSAHSHAISAVTGLQAALNGKQETLVSGTTIKTVNGVSLLGSGDLTVAGGTGAVSSVNGQVGAVVLSAADVGAAETTHTHAIDNVAGLEYALSTKADRSSIASTVRTTPLVTLNVDTSPATAITKSDSVINAFGKLQAQINAGAGGTGGVALGGIAAAAPGTASAGTASTAARSDHVHPAQTTITGNAGTATKLATARTISLTGDVTGSVTFDGSANAAITATVADDSHNHVISNVDGLQGALDGKQATLVSGTNIKTINGVSILGSGDLTVSGSLPTISQSGAGAVARDGATKIKDTFNVRDYNAAVNGVTDDTTSISNSRSATSNGSPLNYNGRTFASGYWENLAPLGTEWSYGSPTSYPTDHEPTKPLTWVKNFVGTPATVVQYNHHAAAFDTFTKKGVEVQSGTTAVFRMNSYSANNSGTNFNKTNQVAIIANASALDTDASASVEAVNGIAASLYTGTVPQMVIGFEANVTAKNAPGFFGQAGKAYSVGYVANWGGPATSEDGTVAFSAGTTVPSHSWWHGFISAGTRNTGVTVTRNAGLSPHTGVWVGSATTYGVYVGAKTLHDMNPGQRPDYVQSPAIGIALGQVASRNARSNILRFTMAGATEGAENHADIHYSQAGTLLFEFNGANKFGVTSTGIALTEGVYVGGAPAIGPRKTGYAGISGTQDRASTLNTSTVTLQQLAARVAALQADLTAHGLIGS